MRMFTDFPLLLQKQPICRKIYCREMATFWPTALRPWRQVLSIPLGLLLFPLRRTSIIIIFSPWLYIPILGLGRLHKTSRFISVTRSRTVGSTPWTGDQLFARPLLPAPGDCDEVGGINGFGSGTRSTRRKPAPMPLCPSQIPLTRPGREPGPPRWESSD
jgi:hypothetical protein